MKHNLHRMMAMFLAGIFAVSVWAQTDMTSVIKNASVSENADWEGGLGHGNGGLYKTSAESFDFTQTISLPAGQYKMTAQAAYRYAGSSDGPTSEEYEYNQIKAGANTHLAKLYAETATYKYEANVQNRWEGASETNYAGDGVSTVNGKYVPNSSNAVKTWFDNGKYVNELVFNVQEDGAVKIGIAKNAKAPNGDYTNIGAWTLTRLGDAEADPKEDSEEGDTDVVLVDCTDKVGTSKDDWKGNNGGPVNIDGVSMPEKYEKTTETLGDVMWQTVTGLENGTYTVELYANARYTPGRNFNSDAADGALDFTYLFANNVEISIEVYHNGDLNNGKSYKLEGVEVTDGTLKMGMTKKGAGSNWHTIQIKSLAMHVSNNEALNIAKADLKAVLDEANAVSPAVETLTAAIAAAQGVYDASKDQEEVIAATAALKRAIVFANNTNAVAGATIANPVVTNFVVNGTFDTNGVTAPWKTTTQAQNQTTATNQQGAFTGNFFENWHPSNYAGKIYQVIENIPNGLYELSICAFVNTFDASAQFVYANADKKALAAGAPTAYKVRTIVAENKIEVGLVQESAVANWMGIDNVSLKFFGEVDENYAKDMYASTKAAAEALLGEKMSAEAKATLEAALAVEVDETSDEALIAAEAALQEVMATVKVSVNFFASNKTAIDGMFSLMESTNVYTAEAFLAYKSIADDYLAQYEDGTLTATVDNPAAVHGWHAEVAYDDMLLSAFGTNNFDTNLYINTWSTEGENDGTDFKVPFFEYWTGDDSSLPATTKTAVVTGLKAGQLYSVEAWVRVRAKNGVAAAEATGITLSVGDGEAVDLTEGEVVGTSQFSLAVYEAVGAADADGNLTINFNVLEDNNVSWLSFKNLKYAEWSENTGIENINADVETVIYDLSGRRVQKMEKGIYIVNGRKVVK